MLRDVFAKTRLFTAQRSRVNVNQSRLKPDGEKNYLSRRFGKRTSLKNKGHEKSISRRNPFNFLKSQTHINVLSPHTCASHKLIQRLASNPASHPLGVFDSLRWQSGAYKYDRRNTRTNTNIVIFHPLIFGKARQLPIGGKREPHFHSRQDTRTHGTDAVKRVSTLTCLGSASWSIDSVLFRDIYTEDAVPQVPVFKRFLVSFFDLIKNLISRIQEGIPKWKVCEIIQSYPKTDAYQASSANQIIPPTVAPSAYVSYYMFCKEMDDDIAARTFRYLCHVVLLTFLGATTVVALTLISVRVVAAVCYFLLL